MATAHPFTLTTPVGALDALRDRLHAARWPEPLLDGAGWELGTDLEYLRELAAYWADGFDWAAREAALNELPHHRATVDGIGIHFIRVPAAGGSGFPLVLSHGWPDGFWRYLKVLPLLTDPAAHGGDPADAFHLVIPSLPGYGFSARPTGTGWGVDRTADAWATLMARLGYDRYAAQGGDWGSAVTNALAARDKEHLVGIHLNFVAIGPPSGEKDFTEEELASLAAGAEHLQWGTGYSTQQSTRPQTLAYGLVDSPVAQCAWIAEKFWAWCDHDGDPYTALTRDQMLDDISLYWFTATGGSSARLYWEAGLSRAGGGSKQFGREVSVPSAVSLFPGEIFKPSRRWVERAFADLRFYERPERGGHFAAFEQPAAFADQLRRAFRTMR